MNTTFGAIFRGEDEPLVVVRSPVKALLASLFERLGITPTTEISFNDFESMEDIKFAPGCVNVLAIGDPSDPTYGIYHDGEVVGGFYGSYRGRMYQLDAFVQQPSGTTTHFFANNVGAAPEGAWVETESPGVAYGILVERGFE
jgi:hypothetical protein